MKYEVPSDAHDGIYREESFASSQQTSRFLRMSAPSFAGSSECPDSFIAALRLQSLLYRSACLCQPACVCVYAFFVSPYEEA